MGDISRWADQMARQQCRRPMRDPQEMERAFNEIAKEQGIFNPVGVGWSIKWTKIDGTVEHFDVSGCRSVSEAREKCREWASKSGWTPPKWWQWWRWSDNG